MLVCLSIALVQVRSSRTFYHGRAENLLGIIYAVSRMLLSGLVAANAAALTERIDGKPGVATLAGHAAGLRGGRRQRAFTNRTGERLYVHGRSTLLRSVTSIAEASSLPSAISR